MFLNPLLTIALMNFLYCVKRAFQELTLHAFLRSKSRDSVTSRQFHDHHTGPSSPDV